MFDESSHFVLYQPDMGGAMLLFPLRLVPHMWVNYKEEKKALGRNERRTKRNKGTGRHQPPQTGFFLQGKNIQSKKIWKVIFFFNAKCFSPLKEREFRLDIWKKFYTVRERRLWHKIPRESVDTPMLSVFKVRLDEALTNLAYWKVSLLMAGGLEWGDLLGPFQQNSFSNSVKINSSERKNWRQFF